MLKEFQALPNGILGASDFAALFQWKVFWSFSMILTVSTSRRFVECSRNFQALWAL
jgi:hypothetical protein